MLNYNAINWTKFPSTTQGGKAFFYSAVLNNRRFWVIWDRETKSWMVNAQSTLTLPAIHEPVNSVTKGIILANQLAEPRKERAA